MEFITLPPGSLLYCSISLGSFTVRAPVVLSAMELGHSYRLVSREDPVMAWHTHDTQALLLEVRLHGYLEHPC